MKAGKIIIAILVLLCAAELTFIVLSDTNSSGLSLTFLTAATPEPTPEPTAEPTPEPTPEPVITKVILKNDCLPDDIQLTEYTYCTNTNSFAQSYIDTEVIPTNNTRVYFDFECTSGFERKDTWFFGSFDRDHMMLMEVGFHQGQGNVAHFYTATNFKYSQYEDSALRTVATFTPGDYTFTEPVTQSLYIFSRQHMDGGIAGCQDTWGEYTLRVYSCRLWQDEIEVRDYVPCVRLSTGEAGMYELVTGKFCLSNGENGFEQGPEVNTPSEVKAVDGLITENVPVPELEGYVFGGYYTEYGGKGTKCIDENGSVCGNCGKKNGTTLYAFWTHPDPMK